MESSQVSSRKRTEIDSMLWFIFYSVSRSLFFKVYLHFGFGFSRSKPMFSSLKFCSIGNIGLCNIMKTWTIILPIEDQNYSEI